MSTSCPSLTLRTPAAKASKTALPDVLSTLAFSISCSPVYWASMSLALQYLLIPVSDAVHKTKMPGKHSSRTYSISTDKHARPHKLGASVART